MKRVIIAVCFKPDSNIPVAKNVVRTRNVYPLNWILRKTRERVKESIGLQRIQLDKNQIFLHIFFHIKNHQIYEYKKNA